MRRAGGVIWKRVGTLGRWTHFQRRYKRGLARRLDRVYGQMDRTGPGFTVVASQRKRRGS